tara:strand:- start:244 stop:393 length:150 start_codon:yes stop_codon:yes gene_type:complete
MKHKLYNIKGKRSAKLGNIERLKVTFTAQNTLKGTQKGTFLVLKNGFRD